MKNGGDVKNSSPPGILHKPPTRPPHFCARPISAIRKAVHRTSTPPQPWNSGTGNQCSAFFCCALPSRSRSSRAWSVCCLAHAQPSFIAVNKDKIGDGEEFFGVPLASVSRCYDDIANASTRVAGAVFHAECFLSVHMKHLHLNDTAINRCGHCITITGPSERPLMCMVAGFFELVETFDPDMEEKVILVDETMFTYIATTLVSSLSVYSQVTIRMVNCHFPTSPSLDVIRRTDTTVDFKFINTNTITHYVMLGNAKFYADAEGTFVLPRQDKTVHLRVVSLFNDVISVNCNLARQDTASFIMGFPVHESEPCEFVTNNVIFINEESRTTDPNFMWQFFLENAPDRSAIGDLNPVMITNDYLELVPLHADFAVDMAFPSYMDFQRQLRVVYIEVWAQAMVGFVGVDFITSAKNEEDALVNPMTVLCTASTALNYTKYSTDQTRVFGYFKVAVPRDCHGLGNVVRLVLRSTPGVPLRIIRVFAEEISEALPDCRSYSFDCLNTSCTSNHSTRFDGNPMFMRGCEPFCGYCPFGFECTSSGNCLPETVLNQRNAALAVGVWAVLLLCFVL